MTCYHRYNRPPAKGISVWVGEGADQSFAKEADINNIMAKYRVTGYLTDPRKAPTRQPFYGDFTGIPDSFMEAQNMLAGMQWAFMGLPAQLRAMFNNSPAELVDWLSDEGNHAQAREWGLMAPLEAPAPVPGDAGTPAPEPVEKPNE